MVSSISPYLYFCLFIPFSTPFSPICLFFLGMSILLSHVGSSVGAWGIMGSTCHSPTCFLFMSRFPRENKLIHTLNQTLPPLHTYIHSPLSLITYPLITCTHSCPHILPLLCLHTCTHPISFLHQTI